VIRLVLQAGAAFIDPLLQLRDRIAQLIRAIVDRRIAEGNISLVAHGHLSVCTN